MNKNISITNLKIAPNKRSETIALIEECFNYSPDYKFETDFYPLVSPENSPHNHILIDENTQQVVGHIGVKNRSLVVKDKAFPCLLLGGISIKKSFRGHGLLNYLFNQVINNYSQDKLFSFLWSDLNELYQKYDFFEFGNQIQIGKKPFYSQESFKDYYKVKYKHLSTDEQKDIHLLYLNNIEKEFVTFERSIKNWNEIENIDSADFYISKDKNNKICKYFVVNKGFDLQGIIHEFCFDYSREISLLKDFALWAPYLPKKISNSYMTLYAGMLRVNNEEMFKKFIRTWSSNKISITSYSKKEIIYYYNQEFKKLTPLEFFKYVFGPFLTQNSLPDFYFGGLDSV